ncbi:M43 family zinc metalloprotease [Emticicia sp. C21]|uniref:M43 family zinc metalloprotease n=1 Tax=Emticicia sp. C21 TaxID=2302915 RepID=UPI000E34E275|nr:M43 family zinc metalloprotease [Emticicia sp. C21]RFS15776.1 hypothetical protein D0T08_12765 [Emticicia sp. C21]
MKNLLTFALILITLALQAQKKHSDCGTKTPATPRPIAEKDMQRFLRSINAVSVPYCVKVQFTVFADNDGSNRATTDAHIYRQFQNMVNQFNPHGICFTFMGIRQINNSDWNVQDADDEEAEMYDIRVLGNLNVFIHQTLTLGDKNLDGIAYDIPNNDAFISLKGVAVADTINLYTMAHELGHVFGLYHTFTTTYGAESVDRTGSCKDCEDDGDYLCDTPADPDDGEGYLQSNTNASCMYIGDKLDECSTPYTPAMNNIMSYGRGDCVNAFTAGQGNRMRYFIANETGLLNVLAQNDVLMSIQTTISSGTAVNAARDTYTVNSITFNGTSNYTFQSKKVIIGNGARLSPGNGGRVVLKTNPYCN